MKHVFGWAFAAVLLLTSMITSCKNEAGSLYEGMSFADERMERGVKQAAALWREEDGTKEEFQAFVEEHYAKTEEERTALFESLSRMMEKLNESADMLTVELLKPTQLMNCGEPTEVDWIMSGYSASAHLTDDLFTNKVAFITILNFPFYSLKNLYDSNKPDTVYRVLALFINDRGRYGDQPLALTPHYYVNLPVHLLDDVMKMIRDQEIVDQINKGQAGFKIRTYSNRNGGTSYSVEWVDLPDDLPY